MLSDSTGTVLGSGGEGGFLSSVADLFDAGGFMPRWQCGDWSPALGWTHIISDFLIFVAYACIPLSLVYFAFRRRDIALRGVVWLFVAFILSCGLTHLVDASMFYYPAYRFLGVMKVITAGVSLATVVALFTVMPTALGLPGIAEAHKLAQIEIERCRKVEAELVRTRDELESRGAALTGRLHRAHQSLAASGAALVHWDVGTGKILWEAGLADMAAAIGGRAAQPSSWDEILEASEVAKLQEVASAGLKTGRSIVLRLPKTDPGGAKQTLEIRAKPDRGDSEGKVMLGSMSLNTVIE